MKLASKILATAAIAGVGIASGLHRLVWALFWMLATIWTLLCWWGSSTSHDATQFTWWLLALGPPTIIGFVLRAIEAFALEFSFRPNDVHAQSAASSRQNESSSK